MKKIIALICIFAIFSACIIPVNAVSMTPDEDVAKEHGYSILYSLRDGWEVPVHYLAENNRIPNNVIIKTNKKLDISQYVYGEVNDFYGIEVFSVKNIYGSVADSKFEYILVTVDFFDQEKAESWASEHDFITGVYFNKYYPFDCETSVEFDVNMDGSFDTMDYVLIKRVYFGTYPEKKLNCTRGDLNNNREIDSMDYTLLKRAYFGTYELEK